MCVRVNNFPISCNLISVVMRSLFSVLSSLRRETSQRRLIVVVFPWERGAGAAGQVSCVAR